MSEVSPSQSLAGRRVLVVEDESLVAMFVEDALLELGCVVIGPAARVDAALELIRSLDIDAAVLDINVGGEAVFPVAEELYRRDIPVIFATGYGMAGLPEPHSSRIVLPKPYSTEKLRAALEEVLERAR
mgnify:FL=1